MRHRQRYLQHATGLGATVCMQRGWQSAGKAGFPGGLHCTDSERQRRLLVFTVQIKVC